MSRKKAKMLFWAALVVLAYIPYLMQSAQPRRHVASGYATAETQHRSPRGRGLLLRSLSVAGSAWPAARGAAVGGFKAAAGGTGLRTLARLAGPFHR